jgi:hypothetical protein
MFVTAAAAGLLVCEGAGQTPASESANQQSGSRAAPGGVSFVLIDNSNADSWLEIDRTLD